MGINSVVGSYLDPLADKVKALHHVHLGFYVLEFLSQLFSLHMRLFRLFWE